MMVIPVSIARLTNNKAVLAQGMAIYSNETKPWMANMDSLKNTGYEQVKPMANRRLNLKIPSPVINKISVVEVAANNTRCK